MIFAPYFGERMNYSEKEQSVHLTEYLYILTKHRSLIIVSFLTMVALTIFFTFLMKPVYKTTTTIVIEKQQSTSPITGERSDYESYVSESLTFNTHFKLITSRPVLERVVKDLKLDDLDKDKGLEVSFFKKLFSQFKKNIRLLLGVEEKILTPQEIRGQVIKALQKKIDIEEVRDTRLLKVNVEDHDPAIARDIANLLAQAYIDFDINNRMKSSQNTLIWLTDHLYEMKKKLEDAEEGFLSYKRNVNLISVEESQKIITQKITEFNDAYIQARNRRLELGAKLAQIEQILKSSEDISHLRSLIGSQFINDLYSQLMNAEVELSHITKVYKLKHPKVVQIKTKINDIRERIHQEIRKESDNLRAEQAVMLAKETVLQKTMADFENEAMETNRKELKFTILKRNVEMNQKLYDSLLGRLKEADITAKINVSNIRITDKAVLPRVPIKPNKILNIILSIIFGLMIGIGCSFLWEYLDRTLRTEEDIQRYLGLPVLSAIPFADQIETEKAYKPKISERTIAYIKNGTLGKYRTASKLVGNILSMRKTASIAYIKNGTLGKYRTASKLVGNILSMRKTASILILLAFIIAITIYINKHGIKDIPQQHVEEKLSDKTDDEAIIAEVQEETFKPQSPYEEGEDLNDETIKSQEESKDVLQPDETISDEKALDYQKSSISEAPSQITEGSEVKVQELDEPVLYYPYSILLASFRVFEDAEKTSAKYRDKGLPTYWVKVNLGTKGIWFRVFAGSFENTDGAERIIDEFKLIGVLVKKTQYASLIGIFSSEENLHEKYKLLLEYGYSPYIIEKVKGKYYLYAGAFYTKIGADGQCSELILKGIQCQAVDR